MAKQAKVLTGSVSLSMSQIATPVYGTTCCDYYGNSYQYIQYYNYTWPAQQTSTIYTVPSGRTARVEIFHYTPNRSSSNTSSGSYFIGSTDILGSFNNSGWSGSIPISWAPQSNFPSWGNQGQVLLLGGSYPIPKIIYLNAGETIRMVGPASGQTNSCSLAYGFSIIEEY